MLSTLKNLLMISVLGFSVCTTIYATEKEEQLHRTTTNCTVLHSYQDKDYNPFIMKLYEAKNWDEIIDNADQVETILNNSGDKIISLTYDTINIIGQAYWHTQKYTEGMFYFDKLTGLLSEIDKKNPVVVDMAYKRIGLGVNDQPLVPPAVLAIAHAWMATHLCETMYNDMQKDPSIASQLKTRHNQQVQDNFTYAFLLFPNIDSFFNSTAAYFYLANQMYEQANEQFIIALKKLEEAETKPSEDLARDAAYAQEMSQSVDQIALVEITAGNKHLEKAEYQEAAEQYNAAIKKINEAKKPISSSLYEMAGLANYQAKNFPTALAHYKKAKEANPSQKLQFTQNYFNLGQCYYMVGEKHASLQEFQQGFTENPKQTPLVYIAAAQPAMDLNKWVIAAKWLKIAITQDADQPAETYADAGLSFLMIEDNAQALEYLNKALQLNPKLDQRVYNRRDMAQIRVNQQ